MDELLQAPGTEVLVKPDPYSCYIYSINEAGELVREERRRRQSDLCWLRKLSEHEVELLAELRLYRKDEKSRGDVSDRPSSFPFWQRIKVEAKHMVTLMNDDPVLKIIDAHRAVRCQELREMLALMVMSKEAAQLEEKVRAFRRKSSVPRIDAPRIEAFLVKMRKVKPSCGRSRRPHAQPSVPSVTPSVSESSPIVQS